MLGTCEHNVAEVMAASPFLHTLAGTTPTEMLEDQLCTKNISLQIPVTLMSI